MVQEILGPYGQLSEGGPEELALDVESMAGERGTWAYAFLWSRAGTITFTSSAPRPWSPSTATRSSTAS
jgi:hypothetical protein